MSDPLSQIKQQEPFINDFTFYKTRFQKQHKSLKQILTEFKTNLDRLSNMQQSLTSLAADSESGGGNKKQMARQMLVQSKEITKQIDQLNELQEQVCKIEENDQNKT